MLPLQQVEDDAFLGADRVLKRRERERAKVEREPLVLLRLARGHAAKVARPFRVRDELLVWGTCRGAAGCVLSAKAYGRRGWGCKGGVRGWVGEAARPALAIGYCAPASDRI